MSKDVAMTPTTWKAPDTGDTPLIVKFRQGSESRWPAAASKWQWGDRNMPFDIVAYRIAEEK